MKPVCLSFILFRFICLLRVDILGWFYSWRQGSQFYHYYINGLAEKLSYNGLRQMGLISFNWDSLFGALPVDSKQRISFGGSSVVVMVLQFQSIKTYKIGCFDWILIQPCTEVDNAMCWETHLHTCYYHITLVNMLYSVRVEYLISIHFWDSSTG